ncbi:MAG: glycosyltransferase family 39 protein [Desulfobacterales bacterium]|nr:glycosyltransferase family 39 protein [Desulfobacterales bacterium]
MMNVALRRVAGFIEQWPRATIALLLLTAAVVRSVVLFDISHSPYSDFLLMDEQIYHSWAVQLAEGTFESTRIYEFTPLPAYIMAIVYRLFGPEPFYIRIVNLVYGILTCWIIFLIGKNLGGRTVGLISGVMACFYGPFVLYSVVPLKTALAVLLFALTVYFFLSATDSEGSGRKVIAGLAAGLLLNVRPHGIAVIGCLLFAFPVIDWQRKAGLGKAVAGTAAYAAGLLLAISPFMARNYFVAGELALTTPQAGQNLYYGNQLTNPTPYYRPLAFAASSPFKQGVQFTIEASRRTGKTLSHREASAFWMRQVFRDALERPVGFAWKLWGKGLALFNRFEPGDHYHIDFLKKVMPTFRFPFLSLWIVMPLAMATLLTGVAGRKKSLAVFAVFGAYGATLVILYTNTRYRLPVTALLIPLAALGLWRMVAPNEKDGPCRRWVFLLVAVGFFIIAALPLKGTGDMTAYYNTHGVVLKKAGHPDKALEYWRKSSRMNGAFSVYADISMAALYFKAGDMSTAARHLAAVPDDSFAAAQKYHLLGNMMVHGQKPMEAVWAYEKSLSINSGQRKVRSQLIQLLRLLDPRRAALEYRKLKYIEGFYSQR